MLYQTKGVCPDAISKRVTISPVPTMNSVSAVEVCEKEQVSSISFSSSYSSVSYKWLNSNTSIGLSSSGTNSIDAFQAVGTGLLTSANTSIVKVIPSIGGCFGDTTICLSEENGLYIWGKNIMGKGD